MTTEVKVPDIGDFSDVPVVSVLVSVGDTVAEEDPLIELESDKATMEVPSSQAGAVKEIKVAEGDTVTEGDVILLLEAAEGAVDAAQGQQAAPDAAEQQGEAPKAQPDAARAAWRSAEAPARRAEAAGRPAAGAHPRRMRAFRACTPRRRCVPSPGGWRSILPGSTDPAARAGSFARMSKRP